MAKWHSLVSQSVVHPIVSLSYPTAVDRAAGTNETNGKVASAVNVDGVAKQLDTGTYWILISVGPLVWEQLITGAATSLNPTSVLFASATGDVTDDGANFVYTSGVLQVAELKGGAGIGGDLTLKSTSHATPGAIKFGSVGAIEEIDTYAGVGTGLTGAPRMFFGTNAPSNDDSCLLIGRNVTGDSLFSHGIRDESTFSCTTTGAYSAFDSQYVFSSSIHYNHMNQYQARAIYNGTGEIDVIYGFTFQCINTGTGIVRHAYGMEILNPVNSGGGTIEDFKGIYIPAITTPILNSKYAIYSVSTNLPSYHGGFFQFGDGIQAAGTLISSNIKAYIAGESTYVGDDITPANQSLVYVTNIGAKAGLAMAVGANFGTNIGARAGYNADTATRFTNIGSFAGQGITTNGGGINIGCEAGFYETGADKLFIDNAKRTDEADARVKALVYGQFDAAVANQFLTVNGDFHANGTAYVTTALRGETSLWYHYRQVSALDVSPGVSGATFTPPSANTIGGYQLNASTEYLYLGADVHDDWDAATDVIVEVYFEVNIDNGGGGAGDTVDLQLLCYMKGDAETACKLQTLEEAVVVGQSAQYKQFHAVFAIDYDDVSDPVEIGDIMGMRINLETDTSEVDDIIVNHFEFKYRSDQPNAIEI